MNGREATRLKLIEVTLERALMLEKVDSLARSCGWDSGVQMKEAVLRERAKHGSDAQQPPG